MAEVHRQFDAVVAGHICLDIIPRFRDTGAKMLGEIMAPGKLVNVEEAAISTGGSVSNTGLALLKLGVKTLLMGKIGQDYFGNGILAQLADWGVDAKGSMAAVPGEETSYTVVLAPPKIDRIFLHNPGANNTFCSRDINYDLVAQSRLFHLGYPPLMRALYADGGKELVEIFRRVKQLGVTTCIDMSLPDPTSDSGRVDWKDVLQRLLPLVDIVPLSAEEAMFMLASSRFDELKRSAGQGDPLDVYTPTDFVWIGRSLLDMGAAVAAVKCGHRGILLFTAGQERIAAMGAAAPSSVAAWANRALWEEPFLVEKIASATGSGDSAIAGLLAAFLHGCDPQQTIRTACCAGGQNVQVLDAVSGIHTWQETQAMTATWPKRRQTADADWTYDESMRLWHHRSDMHLQLS